MFYSSWLPVKSLYGVNPNPAVSIKLAAKAAYQAMTKGMIAQIRKSPEIYVDFGFSKNHEDVAYLIWWTQ